jgi:tetraacyldisaccharide 4'-kinase
MIKPPKFWRSKNIIALALYPFSVLYSWISKSRYILQKPYRCNCKVICIGNITLGGSGKTPLAIAIGELLITQKFKIAYACKNYGGSIAVPTQVSKTHTASQVIDEAVLLSKTAPTFVAQDRKKAVNSACKAAKIVISDDGFQNNSFYKDLSILALPADKNLENNFIFPAGPLRESLNDGLNKADLTFMMNETKNSHKKTRAIVEKYFSEEKIFKAISKYKLCGPQRKKYIAFCGIAHPSNFFITLDNLEIELVDKLSYPDHYLYTKKDLSRLFTRAKESNAGLITTEKDLLRLSKDIQKKISYLELKLEILDKKRFLVKIKSLHN